MISNIFSAAIFCLYFNIRYLMGQVQWRNLDLISLIRIFFLNKYLKAVHEFRLILFSKWSLREYFLSLLTLNCIQSRISHRFLLIVLRFINSNKKFSVFSRMSIDRASLNRIGTPRWRSTYLVGFDMIRI